jgi:hypothetical protein
MAVKNGSHDMGRDDMGRHRRCISRRGTLVALMVVALVVAPVSAAGVNPRRTVEALGGGCDAFMCGTNHNEVLV